MIRQTVSRLALCASTVSIAALLAGAAAEPAPRRNAAPAPQSQPDLDPDANALGEGAPDPLAPTDAAAPAARLAPGAPAAAPLAIGTGDASPSDPLAAEVMARAASANTATGVNKADAAGLAAYYAETRGQPIWTGPSGPNGKAAKVMAEIGDAGDWGLDAAAFDLPQSAPGAALDEVAAVELKLSLAVLKYARFARGGRIDPTVVSDQIDERPQTFDPKSVLQAIAAAPGPDAYLRGLHPRHEQFHRLRQALLDVEKSGKTAPTVRILAGPAIRPGDAHPQIPSIRERLGVPGAYGGEDVYDAPLVDAVRRYQRDLNLDVTGVIDRKLRAALNEGIGDSTEDKRQRILVNMERWRWMPDDLGEFYVWDSIPEQVTRVYDRGAVTLLEKIVVGRPRTPTPIFTAAMQFVIFHPEWGVPDGIKANEIGPVLRRSSGGGDFFFGGGGASRFLHGQNLRVSYNGREVDPDSVDWSRVDVKRYTFIQPSGGSNVLGVVKFRFPNKHDVYMHDTPQRALFNEKVRAFSHGCMRTQNPVHLAEVVLAHDKGLAPADVQAMAAGGGGPNEIKLGTPIPVHVTYFTMKVDDDGKLQSFGDLYGLDARMGSALRGEAVPPRRTLTADVGDDAAAGAPRGQDRRPVRSKQWNPFKDLFGPD